MGCDHVNDKVFSSEWEDKLLLTTDDGKRLYNKDGNIYRLVGDKLHELDLGELTALQISYELSKVAVGREG